VQDHWSPVLVGTQTHVVPPYVQVDIYPPSSHVEPAAGSVVGQGVDGPTMTEVAQAQPPPSHVHSALPLSYSHVASVHVALHAPLGIVPGHAHTVPVLALLVPVPQIQPLPAQ
jgi:hypothetical protein